MSWITTQKNTMFWVHCHSLIIDNNDQLFMASVLGVSTCKLSSSISIPQELLSSTHRDTQSLFMHKSIAWDGDDKLFISVLNQRMYGTKRDLFTSIYEYTISKRIIRVIWGEYKDIRSCALKYNGFFRPLNVAADKEGNIYATEHHAVRKINLKENSISTVAGEPGYSSKKESQDGSAENAFFSDIECVAVSQDGNVIYVTEKKPCVVRKIQDGMVSTVVPTNGWPFDLQKNPAKSIQVLPNGNLIIANQDGLIKYDEQHNLAIPIKRLNGIDAVCIRNEDIFVATAHKTILKIENGWKWIRFLWIGHLKEKPSDCVLATVPKEIIKEIMAQMNIYVENVSEDVWDEDE